MLKEKQLSGYCVADARLMHTLMPVTIKAADPISVAFEVGIVEKRCRNIYVVDADNTLLGEIRLRDLLRSLFPLTSLTDGIYDGLNSIPSLNANTAGKLMIKPTAYVTDSTPLNKAALTLIKENLFELPVIDYRNRIIGQIDASEIIAFSLLATK